MNRKFFRIALLCMAFLLCGCLETTMRAPGLIDSLLDTVDGLVVANTASAPVNPYATPINIGLAGIVAILEALRRKERSGRKHAEQELNGNNSS